jgi:hypothetical protein
MTNTVPKSVVVTRGDLIVASASGVVARLAPGADGRALITDSTASLGMKYGPKVGVGDTLPASGNQSGDMFFLPKGTTYSAPPANGLSSTTAIINQFSPAEILFWSRCELPLGVNTSKRHTDWETDSTFTNDDGTPSYGFWFPNVRFGTSAYSDADYNFKRDAAHAPPDSECYVEMQIFNGYSNSNAAQIWRRLDRFGNPFPRSFDASWWVYYPDVIAYDNGGSGQGFTNMVQWYQIDNTTHTLPNKHLVSSEPGKNNLHDSYFRYHFFGQGFGAITEEPAQLQSPVIQIPTGQWIFNQAHYEWQPNSSGKLGLWHNTTKVFDYTGQTCLTETTQVGISWGVYGTLLTPDNPVARYSQVLVSTTPALPKMQAAASIGDGTQNLQVWDGTGWTKVVPFHYTTEGKWVELDNAVNTYTGSAWEI